MLQLGHKAFQIGKFPIYRREPDISNFINRLEFVQDHFADFLARDFLSQGIPYIPFYVRNDVFQLLPRNHPLIAGPQQAVQYLAAVEELAAAVALNDDERRFFHHLVRRKPPAAALAFPAAANGSAVVRGPRIGYFCIVMLAKRTFHDVFLLTRALRGEF